MCLRMRDGSELWALAHSECHRAWEPHSLPHRAAFSGAQGGGAAHLGKGPPTWLLVPVCTLLGTRGLPLCLRWHQQSVSLAQNQPGCTPEMLKICSNQAGISSLQEEPGPEAGPPGSLPPH